MPCARAYALCPCATRGQCRGLSRSAKIHEYLCLVYLEKRSCTPWPTANAWIAAAGFRSSGLLIAAEALQPVETATSVRVRNGKASVIDGPFAETKEQLAGFYLIEAGDLNDAIEVAAKIRRAREGTIEVRPIRS